MRKQDEIDGLTTLLYVLCVLIVEALVHELVHLVINLGFTQQIRPCGFGPIFLAPGGRLGVCLVDHPLVHINQLVTPLLMATVGILMMIYAQNIERKRLRWTSLTAGAVIWMTETLYAMGWLNPPTLVDGSVHVMGDGVSAIEAFGPIAMVPGAVLLVVGIFVLSSRVEFEEGPINGM